MTEKLIDFRIVRVHLDREYFHGKEITLRMSMTGGARIPEEPGESMIISLEITAKTNEEKTVFALAIEGKYDYDDKFTEEERSGFISEECIPSLYGKLYDFGQELLKASKMPSQILPKYDVLRQMREENN